MAWSKDNSRAAKLAAEEALVQAQRAETGADYIAEVTPKIDEFVGEQTNLQTQLNDLVLQSGTDIAEVVQARGGEVTLNERLNKTTAQLAEKALKTEVNSLITNKAEKTYVDNQLSALDTKVTSQASGSPKGTYATVTALQIAFPTGNSNIYVVSADGKWYYWNDTVWTAGGLYQATLSNDFPATNLVKNGNFSDTSNWNAGASKLIASNNKLVVTGDGTAVNPRIFQSLLVPPVVGHRYFVKALVSVNDTKLTNLILELYTTTSGTLPKGSIDIGKANAGEKYELSTVTNPVTDPTGVMSVRVLTTYANAADALNKETTISNVLVWDLTATFGAGKEPDEKKIRELLSRLPNGWFDGQLGMMLTTKDLYNLTVDLNDSTENIISYQHNLFNGVYKPNIGVSANVAVNFVFVSTGSENWRTGVVEIERKKYKIKVRGDHNRFGVALSNSYLANAPLLALARQQDPIGDSELIIDNTTHGYKYLLIYVSSTGQNPETLVYEGEEIPESLTSIKIFGKEVAISSDVPSFEATKKYAQFYEIDNTLNAPPTMHTDLYDLYDALVTEFPTYITKEVLGLNTQGKEVRAYRFKKPNIINDIGLRRQRIGILTGLHGDEKTTAVGVYQFIKDMCQNVHKNEKMDKVKGALDFYILPCGNPTGWDMNTRENGAGVNLNRNFMTHWVPTEQTDSNSGTKPASELETQYIQAWMVNNALDFFIDYHTFPQGTTNNMHWLAANSNTDNGKYMKKKYYSLTANLSNRWSQRFDTFPEDVMYGSTNIYGVLAQSQQHADSLGIKSALLEAVWRATWLETTVQGFWTNIVNSELIGNYIFELASDYIS